MAAQTSMLHIRVDDKLKADAAEQLAGVGLTVSDAVRILLTRVVKEGALPAGLTADPEAYDAWFRRRSRRRWPTHGRRCRTSRSWMRRRP